MTIDTTINIVIGVLTIFGWFAAFWFGVRQQRLNIIDSAKLKVYEDLSKKYEEFQNMAIKLTTLLQGGFPFSLIETDRDMPKQLLGIQGITDPSQLFNAEWQGKQKAIERANNYVSQVSEAQGNFNDRFLEFWRLFEMWSALLPDLRDAMRVLSSEYTTFSAELSSYVTFLITIDKYNTEKWDKYDLGVRATQIWEHTNNISCYTIDLMALIHNELVTPLLKQSKQLRKTRDTRYKVLTKKGLVVRLETDTAS